MKRRYPLACNGHHAVCPCCGGLLKRHLRDLQLKCNDCRSVFICVDAGSTERELIYEKV